MNNRSRALLLNSIPSVANLSDAMGQLGLKFHTMHSRIRPVFTPVHVSGPAYTVQCYPGATWALEEAIEKAPRGSLLVVDGGNYTEAVLMGELMSGRAAKRGVAGAIIDGAVRDTAMLRKVRWPIFASGITPRAGTFDKLGAQQITVSCGGVVVSPGDLIVADDDGIVVVPSRRSVEVIERARHIEEKERFLASAIRKNLSLAKGVAGYNRKSGTNK